MNTAVPSNVLTGPLDLSTSTQSLYDETRVEGLPLFMSFLFLFICTILHNLDSYQLAIPAVIVAVLMIREPEYAALFLIVLTLTVSYPSYPLVIDPSSEKGFSVIEIAVLAFALRAIFHASSWKEFGVGNTIIGKSFILYFGGLVFVLAWHLLHGNTAVNSTRGYFLILTFLPIATLLKTDRQWFTLFRGLLILAFISGIFALLVYFHFGDTAFWNSLIGSFRVDEFATADYLGPSRVVLGGLYLAYTLAFVSIARIGSAPAKKGLSIPFLIFSLVIMLVSFTRAIVFTFMIGLALILVYAFLSRARFLPIGRVFAVLLVVLLFTTAFVVFDWLDISAVMDRFLVVFRVDRIEDVGSVDSMSGRSWENAIAAKTILREPLFGGGFGHSFLVEEREAAAPVPHNAYVSLAYLFGIPALIFFLILAGSYLQASVQLLRGRYQLPAIHRCWLFGFSISFVGYLIASFAAQYVTVKAATLVAILLAYSHYLTVKFVKEPQRKADKAIDQ